MKINSPKRHKMTTIRLRFDSLTERDEFIDTYFPKRKCDETPGFYRVPIGHLGVYLCSVVLYPKRRFLK